MLKLCLGILATVLLASHQPVSTTVSAPISPHETTVKYILTHPQNFKQEWFHTQLGHSSYEDHLYWQEGKLRLLIRHEKAGAFGEGTTYYLLRDGKLIHFESKGQWSAERPQAENLKTAQRYLDWALETLEGADPLEGTYRLQIQDLLAHPEHHLQKTWQTTAGDGTYTHTTYRKGQILLWVEKTDMGDYGQFETVSLFEGDQWLYTYRKGKLWSGTDEDEWTKIDEVLLGKAGEIVLAQNRAILPHSNLSGQQKHDLSYARKRPHK